MVLIKVIKKRLIWVIILVSLIIRLGYISFIPQFNIVGSGSDIEAYDLAAQHILKGKTMPFYKSSSGDVEITIPPGFPLFLAFSYRIFANNFYSAKFLQSILAAFVTYFIFILGRDIFGKDVGYVSAFLYAIYPSLLIYNGLLYTEIVFTSFLIIAMYFLNMSIKHEKIKFFILTGIFLGIASLISSRSMFLPVLILFGFLFLFRRKSLAFSRFFYIVLAMLIVISPWTIRNYIVSGGKFILLENYNQSGTSLWLALNPYGRLTNWNYYDEKGNIRSPHDELPVNERIPVIRNEAKMFLKKYPFNFVKYSPKRFFLLWFSGHSYYIKGLEKSLQSIWTNGEYLKLTLKLSLLLFNLFFIFLGFLGIFLNWRKTKETFPILLPIVYFTALHSFYVTAARLQIPMIPFLLIFSGYAIVFIKNRFNSIS